MKTSTIIGLGAAVVGTWAVWRGVSAKRSGVAWELALKNPFTPIAQLQNKPVTAPQPAVSLDDPNTMFDESKRVVLRPNTFATGGEGEWVVTELPTNPKTSTGRVSWVPPYTRLQWTPGGDPWLVPNPPTLALR